ncbi:RsmB/NOP family class I SAM-dependent RNA methyltransferase [Anaeromyxobacter paludicola]|uniref:NOL1/NOP2/Sun family protein n=1 Tax=Anaeromyxobacter paludicola TaxID=2918171 RepID=A0ABN6N8C7_9BACT|nr:RNA methyltransferase [Anaeromyxobacter paludicola]BDG09461.1 NOL1/NOP2/Sun family protein [Anaeromyxobacter paludicola]
MATSRALRTDLVDAVVLEVYGLVRDQGWLADRALERVLRREKRLYAVERRAAAESVYGLIRAQGQLDFVLTGALPGEAARARPALSLAYAAWLARSGAAPLDAAAKRLGVPRRELAPVEAAGKAIAALADPLSRFAVEASLPRWIAERFAAELGLDEAVRLGKAMNERAPLTVRANLLRGPREDLQARLAEEGVESTPTPHSPWGLTLDGHANAFALRAFQEGHFEIQDEGSQLIALALGARPNHKLVVDACAGAGGKSLALAMEMRNKGSLLALDPDAERLEEAKRRARRAGVHNLRDRAIPPDETADEALKDLAGKAERVLVDAPCSGLGTLRRKPDARWRLRPEDPARFAGLQRSIAVRCAKLLKPGGRLVYATCSLGRTENDEVADFLATAAPGLVPVPLSETLGAERAAALGADGNRLQLYPHRHGTDGFFMALFQREK